MRRPWRYRLSPGALACLLAWAGCTEATAPPTPHPLALSFALAAADGVSASEGAALGAAFDRVDRFRVVVTNALSGSEYVNTVVRVRSGASQHELTVDLPESALQATLSVTLTALQGDVPLFTASVQTTASAPERGGPVVVEVGVRYVGPGIRGSVVGNDGRGAAGAAVQVRRGGQTVATATTASDGSYLVLDLPPGDYTVRLANQAGLTSCPGERRVTLADASTSAVAAFQYRAGACTTRVLVLSGGDVDDTGAVVDLLQGIADQTVEAFFFIARTPGIERLRAYDVVLLYQNGLFDDARRLGDELAQYVSLGGNVVFGSFYWQGRSDAGTGGRGWGALETVDPFVSVGGASYTPGALGTATAHPLTEGVRALTSTGYRGGVATRSGTAVVALWDDGVPLVGYREGSVGQRMVAVSLYPAHGRVGGVSGDFGRLWRNAVAWAGQAGGPARTGPVGGAR